MSKNNLLVSLENAGIYKSPKWLIRGVSLEVKSGQIVTLIGPNGSGKTTTAKMVLNILEPDEGSLKRYTNKIAYVPQKINIDWTMPLRVVDFMRLTNNLSNNEIIESLNQTGVEKLFKEQIHGLSGGEFQRVLLARAIAKKPELLVLDEPSSNLDPASRRELIDILKNLKVSIILVTHDLPMALEICNRSIILNNGQITADADTYKILKDSKVMEENRLELPFGFALHHLEE